MARRDHVIGCKFSGIVTEVRDTEWSVELLRPYWDVAFESFGSDRLMYGSDWPVILLRSDYARWVSAVEQLSGSLSSAEQAAFWVATQLAFIDSIRIRWNRNLAQKKRYAGYTNR